MATNPIMVTEEFCLVDGCYSFIVSDSYGDGMSGSQWSCGLDGDYQILDATGNILGSLQNTNFGTSETSSFCLNSIINGCTDPIACNYNSVASLDHNTCFFVEDMAINADGVFYDCSGLCLNDTDGDAICDELEILGCQEDGADNYNLEATDAGECIYYGCVDTTACNYDVDANTVDNSCWYPAETYLDCEGECLSDVDFDGVCDEAEIYGCTDENA